MNNTTSYKLSILLLIYLLLISNLTFAYILADNYQSKQTNEYKNSLLTVQQINAMFEANLRGDISLTRDEIKELSTLYKKK